MTTSLQKSQLKHSNVLGKIKVQGEMDLEQRIIVRCETATLKWRGFKSQMAIWTKIYGEIQRTR
jgi:hypothetical protein